LDDFVSNSTIKKNCTRNHSSLRHTYSEEDKESLIVLAYTVVDPRTVVIHLSDASLTDTNKQNKEKSTDQF